MADISKLPQIPGASLPFYDALVAIRLDALNAGLSDLFDLKKLAAGWQVEVDSDFDCVYSVQLGKPFIRLSPEEHTLRLVFPITRGAYSGAMRVRRDGTRARAKTKLDGKELSFAIDFTRGGMGGTWHGASASSLYVELTKVKSVDTTNFSMHTGRENVDVVLHAFVAEMKRTANDPDRPLILSEVEVKDPVASGAFEPTSCRYSFVEAGADSEILVLMKMGGRPLPTVPYAGKFARPWCRKGADAAVIFSDTLMLHAFVKPVLQAAYGRHFALTITDASEAQPAFLHGLVQQDEYTMVVVEAALFSGVISIRTTARTKVYKATLLGTVTVAVTRLQKLDLGLELNGQNQVTCLVKDEKRHIDTDIKGTGLMALGALFVNGLKEAGIAKLPSLIDLNSSRFRALLQAQLGQIVSKTKFPASGELKVKAFKGDGTIVRIDGQL